MRDIFRGNLSVRYSGERLAFVLTLLFAFPAAAAIGYVLREDVHPSQIAVLGVIGMVYVTLARGRLVGSSVRIHESQYPHVFAIVKRCAAALDLPVPLVFVRDDPVTPLVSVGLGDPYSLVISSNWIEHFNDDELAFMVGRELGHIAAGHARITSLLSVNGNENAIISLIFGAWLRRTELTADRVGLLCCGSLDAAMRAIVVASLHAFGRKVDHMAFAEQARDIHTDSVLRLGELIGSMPYATRRIEAMREFFATEQYRQLEERFINDSTDEEILSPETLGAHVEKRDLAGWWRRMSAVLLDVIIVQALVATLAGAGAHIDVNTDTTPAAAKTVTHATTTVKDPDFSYAITDQGITFGKNVKLTWLNLGQAAQGVLMPVEMCLYFGLLVGIAGQTPGMMITGLRVVRTDFRKPGIAQSLTRYIVGLLLCWWIFPASPFSRLYLHDRISKTRTIKTERVLARVRPA